MSNQSYCCSRNNAVCLLSYLLKLSCLKTNKAIKTLSWRYNWAGKLQSRCLDSSTTHRRRPLKYWVFKALYKSHTATSSLGRIRLHSPSFQFEIPDKLLPNSHSTLFPGKYSANNSIIIEPSVSFLHYSHSSGWL